MTHYKFMRMKKTILSLLSLMMFDLADAQLYIPSGAVIKVSAADVLIVEGDLQNNVSLDYLTIGGGSSQSISGTGTITNLKINKSSGTTATLTGGMQTVTGVLELAGGTLAAGGYLTLQSTATGTARVASHVSGTGEVTGEVNVERYIDVDNRAKQWRILGFPYSNNITVGSIQGFSIDYTAGTRSVMFYNEGGDDGLYGAANNARNAGYQSFTASSETLAAGKGVMAWIYGNSGGTASSSGNMSGSLTVSSRGELNESGNAVSMPVFHTAARANHGWNLLSNPFASSIDWNSGAITKTGIHNAIYRWHPQLGGWTSYNAGTGTPAGVDNIIESGGAFFVEANADNPVLTIGQGAKTTSATGYLHFERAPRLSGLPGEQAPASKLRFAGIRMSASGQGNPFPDEAYLDLSKTDATAGFDGKYDAVSMGRSSGAGIAVKDDKQQVYAMQFDRPIREEGVEKRYYPLKVTTPAVGTTTLEIWTEGDWNPMNSVSLIDQKEGRIIPVKGGRLSYAFNLDELKSENRFLLAINHLKLNPDGLTSPFDVKLLGNPVTTPSIDLIITHPTAAASRWQLLNTAGQQVGSGTFNKDMQGVQHKVSVPGMNAAGSYILKVYMDNGDEKIVRVIKN